MQPRAQMFHALGGIFEIVGVKHAKAVTHRGFILDGQRLLKGLGSFLVAALIVHDHAQQVQRLGIAGIKRYGPLGKGFCGFPVLRANEVLHQMNNGCAVIGIFCHLTHENAYLLRDAVLSGGRAGLPLLRKARTFKTFFKGYGQHDHQAQTQQDNERAGCAIAL